MSDPITELREAAQAVLDEWDEFGPTGTESTLASHKRLREALANSDSIAKSPAVSDVGALRAALDEVARGFHTMQHLKQPKFEDCYMGMCVMARERLLVNSDSIAKEWGDLRPWKEWAERVVTDVEKHGDLALTLRAEGHALLSGAQR